jgi:branched-chain amino acid transport system ATP-binding protein
MPAEARAAGSGGRTARDGVPLLEVEDLELRYGHVVAVRNLSFVIRSGECVALLGPNGAGKSSTLRAISGLLRPSKGTVRFRGHHVEKVGVQWLARHGMSHVPEGRGVFPDLSVRENLRMPSHGLDRAAVDAALERVHGYFPRLLERRSQAAGTLSGGEQQQLVIARALMKTPQLLLLDEMSLGLAPTIVEQLFDILQRINRDGVAVLLVEQYVGPALTIADTAVVLEKGSVRVSGRAAALACDVSVVQASYLGATVHGAEPTIPNGPAFRELVAGVSLRPDQVRRLDELAVRRGTTSGELGSQAIEHMLTMAGG